MSDEFHRHVFFRTVDSNIHNSVFPSPPAPDRILFFPGAWFGVHFIHLDIVDVSWLLATVPIILS